MALPRLWITNRVVLGLVAILALTGFWEFKWKPQYRGYYVKGVQLYHSGKYLEAEDAFSQAYNIEPNAMDVILMEGWTNLKLNRVEVARYYFDRALRIDSGSDEANIGMSFVKLESGRGELNPVALSRILETRKNDPDVLFLLATWFDKQARYSEAARLYCGLLTDKTYASPARLAIARISALPGSGDVPQSCRQGAPQISSPRSSTLGSSASGSSAR